MRTDVKREDRERFDLGLDRKYIWADSPICHYCARCNFMDPEFDKDKCNECGSTHKNFLGVDALVWRERE